VLHARRQPGPGQRDRGAPAAARGAGDDPQYPTAATGEQAVTTPTMTAQAPEPAKSGAAPTSTPPRTSLASRIVSIATGGLVRVFLVVVGVLWLLPTAGLL